MLVIAATIQTAGLGGIGHFAGEIITAGVAHTRIGDEWHLIYRDDGAGTFNDLMPETDVDDGDATVTISNQALDATFTDTNTKLLLHGDGVDAATTTVDSSLSGHMVTLASSAQIDTAQNVFGASSLYFTGAGDKATISDHADFDFGSGDFTIDFRIRFEAIPGGQVDLYEQNDNNIDGIVLLYQPGDDTLFFAVIDSTSVTVLMATEALSLVIDTWYHIAIVRNSSTWTIYLDGVSKVSTNAAVTIPDIDADIEINGDGANCWIDEFRVVKGEAKWTTGFTPDAHPYGWDDLITWRYKRRGVSPGGIIGEAGNETDVTVTAAGDLYFAAGNDPIELTLTLITAGAARIDWRYSDIEQPAIPTGFKVYRLIAGIYILADTIAFISGINRYSSTSGTFANGTSLDFTVRTYRTVSDVDYEQLSDNVTGTSDALAPDPVTSLVVSE